MTDLNEWNLAYLSRLLGDVSYDFGHSSNDSPFTVQVDVGDPDRTIVDQQHGTANASLMGRDLLGGRDLTFTLTTLPDRSGGGVALNAMDKISEFGAKWRAFDVSRIPGDYATVTNKLRDRWAIGRPRQFSPKYARTRRGLIEYLAVFHTTTPDFYQNPINSLDLPDAVEFDQDIGGDLPAWPVITFTGKFDTATLGWVPTGFVDAWFLGISHVTATNIPIVIDTRPWSRGVRDADGALQGGWLIGNKMDDCMLAPSTGGHFFFNTTGATDGNTGCTVSWYDTYAGL